MLLFKTNLNKQEFYSKINHLIEYALSKMDERGS